MKELSSIPRIRPPESPLKPRSPKRVLSTSRSKLLRLLDAAKLDDSTISGPCAAPRAPDVISRFTVHKTNDDPFGPVRSPRSKMIKIGRIDVSDSNQCAVILPLLP